MITIYPASTSILYSGAQTLTAAQMAQAQTNLGLPVTLFKGLTANETRNDTDVMAVTALSLTVKAATQYALEIQLFCTNAARDGKYDLDGGTATMTDVNVFWVQLSEVGLYLVGARTVALATDFDPNSAPSTANVVTASGSLLTNAAGTLILRFAQVVADASDTQILKGSYIKLTEIV